MLASAPTTGTRRPRTIRLTNIFAPLPWQIAPWRDTAPIVLLTGAAGGGKSRLAAEKVHAYCLKYPGATALIARKAKTSMSGGTILFLRRKVIGTGGVARWIDSPKYRFEYANGSIIQFVGLLDEEARDNLKSIGQDGGVDTAWLEEGTQFDEADLNAMTARMRGKAAPWRQILITTNPDGPLHWIKQRLIDGGAASVYVSTAADNTHNPADYAAWLETLTGIERARLVDGQWVQAEGLIYGEVWRDGPDDGNVTNDADYLPAGGPVLWAVDDGYVGQRDAKTGAWTAQSHPRVFLLVQQRHNGQLCIFAESYHAQMLEPEHLQRVQALPYPVPEYAVVDKSAATLKGHLHAASIATVNGAPRVDESIKLLRGMLAADANGVRRVLVHPRCRDLRAEFASYRYKPGTTEPEKAFDHGVDAARYFCWSQRYD